LGLIFFILFSATAVIASLLAVTRREPIYSVLFLVLTLCATAGLFLMLGAYFLAVLQVLIYAGAVVVLFLFVVMLIRREDTDKPRFPGLQAKIVAPLVAVLLGLPLLFSLWMRDGSEGREASGTLLPSGGETASIGRALFSTHILPFEVASLLLLVAVLGAMALARERK